MSRLTQFEDSRNYNIFTDTSSTSLVLAMPFNKENGVRDVSHLIRGTGSEFTNITYNRIKYGDIVNHETCHYDSCIRFPYTPYHNTLNILFMQHKITLQHYKSKLIKITENVSPNPPIQFNTNFKEKFFIQFMNYKRFLQKIF